MILSATFSHAEQRHQTALVGRSVAFEQVVLEGPQLELKPIDDETPVVVRIRELYPHGSAYRYSFAVYGLEPGTFNVLDFLQRTDGLAVSELPAITLQVQSTLPADQVEPQPLSIGRSPRLGGYRLALLLGGVAWLAGLIWLFRVGRKPVDEPTQPSGHPITTADRLRPLVHQALAGQLSSDQRAVLERLLLAHWREKLKLTELEPLAAMAALRDHAEADELMRRLEDWLHRPDPPQEVDVEALLAPYAQIGTDDAGRPRNSTTPSRETISS